MKISRLIVFALPFLVIGCHHKTGSGQSSPTGPTTFSNAGYAFKLGGFTTNGTNVPMSNITVKVMQNTNVSFATNEVSK